MINGILYLIRFLKFDKLKTKYLYTIIGHLINFKYTISTKRSIDKLTKNIYDMLLEFINSFILFILIERIISIIINSIINIFRKFYNFIFFEQNKKL